MLNKMYKIGFFATVFLAPFVTNAQLTETTSFFEQALFLVQEVLIPLVFTLALLFFFWGVARYIWSEGKGKDEGKQIMFWGVIALFVMSSIWGIVAFLRTELNLGDNSSVPIPTIGGSGSNTDYWDSQSP